MNPKNNAKGIWILLAFSVLLILGLFGIVLRSVTTPPQQDPTTFPSPTPNPFQLSEQEKNLPQATPQPFRHAEERETGTLVVTANVEGTEVFLDASAHPDPEDPIPTGQKWPVNKTPFSVESMPVGKHVLFAIKSPTHDTAEYVFEIKKGQITRVHIELVPLRTFN